MAAGLRESEQQIARQTPGSHGHVIREAGTNPKDYLEIHTEVLQIKLGDYKTKTYNIKTYLFVNTMSRCSEEEKYIKISKKQVIQMIENSYVLHSLVL